MKMYGVEDGTPESDRRQEMEKKKELQKTKDYLICLDSDGTVIDGMTIKHLECFGPEVIKEWKMSVSYTHLTLPTILRV